jgi:hypothetical protein
MTRRKERLERGGCGIVEVRGIKRGRRMRRGRMR